METIDNEKKDIHDSEKVFNRSLEKIKKSAISEKQKKDIEKFVLEIRIGKYGSKVKAHRIISYLYFFLKTHDYFKKDFDKITEKEWETFYTSLQDDKIKKVNGLSYSKFTKEDWIKAIKKYLGWKLGKDNKDFTKRVGWMKKERCKSDKRAITLEQCNKIVAKEQNIRNKALFMTLFDSGMRIEELLNVRLHDLEVVKKENTKGEYYMVKIRISKTKTRNISLPLCTDILTKWIKKHPQNNDKNAFLFPLEYDNVRKIIRVMSKQIIDFNLSPHSLRHASVTFYVQKFGLRDIAGFYYRFGWSFGSPEAKPYIDDHLLGGEQQQTKIVETIEYDQFKKIQKELAQQKEKIDKIVEFMKRYDATMKKI